MIFQLALLFFIVLDSVGNVPLFASLLRHFELARQRAIILRELIIALIIMVFFLYFGDSFFKLLNIDQHTLEITGGIILFVIAIDMIFARGSHQNEKEVVKEPLIVPLAVPATAGPAILATIVLQYNMGISQFVILGAIFLAWLASLIILLLSPQIKRLLGDNGTIALERLFGYIIVLIATEMIAHGIQGAFLS